MRLTSPAAPLRILMVNHVRWSRNLGASRVQLELAEEFQKLGHHVEKFSYDDAFPGPEKRWQAWFRNFSRHARAYVRRHGHRFDIIDANQTDLPYPKASLGFRGLLVARSVGLIPLYRELFFDRDSPEQRSSLHPKRLAKAILTYPAYRRRHDYVLPSLQHSDLINVANADEVSYVRDRFGLGDKCVSFPFGLTDERYAAFTRPGLSARDRLDRATVAFVGSWEPRKGVRDWPQILARVRSRVPAAEVLFLGTGCDADYVRSQLGFPGADWIRVVPRFDSNELPDLLTQATVGAFPSYVEGFGFAVLEKLASGLPTVTYDAPGPREMMRHLPAHWMTPPGAALAFGDRLADLLELDSETYGNFSAQCQTVAGQFLWRDIARRTLNAYAAALNALPRP